MSPIFPAASDLWIYGSAPFQSIDTMTWKKLSLWKLQYLRDNIKIPSGLFSSGLPVCNLLNHYSSLIINRSKDLCLRKYLQGKVGVFKISETLTAFVFNFPW